jgi:hypothetical protein
MTTRPHIYTEDEILSRTFDSNKGVLAANNGNGEGYEHGWTGQEALGTAWDSSIDTLRLS